MDLGRPPATHARQPPPLPKTQKVSHPGRRSPRVCGEADASEECPYSIPEGFLSGMGIFHQPRIPPDDIGVCGDRSLVRGICASPGLTARSGASVDCDWKSSCDPGHTHQSSCVSALALFTSLGGVTFSGHAPWFDGDWGKREQTVQDAI